MPEQRSDEAMFSDFVRTMTRGALDEEATAEMQELVKEMTRIAETSGGKPKGKLVLTVNFSLDRGVMDVDAKVTIARPARVRARTIMYPQRDGSLSKEDESQGRLFAGEVKDGIPNASDIR